MAAKKKSKKNGHAEAIVATVVTDSVEEKVSNGLVFGIEGPIYPDGCLHFSPNDLIRYELLQERVQSNLQQIGLNMGEKERVANTANREIERIQKEANARIAALDGVRVNLVSVGKTREEDLRRFQEGLSVAYNGLDLTKTSYDETSGKIFVMEADGEPQPVFPQDV